MSFRGPGSSACALAREWSAPNARLHPKVGVAANTVGDGRGFQPLPSCAVENLGRWPRLGCGRAFGAANPNPGEMAHGHQSGMPSLTAIRMRALVNAWLQPDCKRRSCTASCTAGWVTEHPCRQVRDDFPRRWMSDDPMMIPETLQKIMKSGQRGAVSVRIPGEVIFPGLRRGDDGFTFGMNTVRDFVEISHTTAFGGAVNQA